MDYKFKYASKEASTILNEKDGLLYITFPKLAAQKDVIHGCSTRIGGVSEGIFSSMNLSFTRGDNSEHVRENYRRIGKAIGIDETKLVFSDQVHKTTIHVATKEDMGKGIVKPRELKEIDGLVTNEPGIPMVTFYADCVPLLFYDPVEHVAGMAHSGWKGTVAKIGEKMVQKMNKLYGTKPENIITAIGPSICKDCYEISEDVALEFERAFPREQVEVFLELGENHKYQLDLWKVNEYILTGAGIKRDNLDITNLCTCCNKELLFSHRGSKGKRGNLGVFMCLKER